MPCAIATHQNIATGYASVSSWRTPGVYLSYFIMLHDKPARITWVIVYTKTTKKKNDNYARTHIDGRYLCVFSACSSRCARGRSVLFTFDVFLKRHDFFTGHAGLARARRRDTPGSLYGHGKFDARRRSTQAACAVSVPPPAHALNVLLL